jgi:sulfoxide reductase heme-binding subunit YedZ
MSQRGAAMAFIRAGFEHRLAKPMIFSLCLLPFVYLVWAAMSDHLGANPAEALVRATGDWTLRVLCLVLAVTPVRVLSGLAVLARFRRMLGLFVYFYALLHLLSFSGFDMGFDLGDIAKDIVKRPFILVGFAAFLILTALAGTSFSRAIKALGAKNWRRLHKLVYLVAGLAILHFYWMRAGKNNFADVTVYALVLGVLLAWRVWQLIRKNRPQPSFSMR